LAQRAATVEADVVHSAVSAVYIGHADSFVATGEFFGFVSGRKFGLGSELRKVWHVLAFDV
jgi:hypothetical protein